MSELKSGRSRSVSAKTAQKIADHLGVSVGYLLTGEETAPTGTTMVLTPEEVERLQWLRDLPPEKLEALKTLLGK